MNLRNILFSGLLLFFSASCSKSTPALRTSLLPPQHFKESDLIGLWEVSNAQYSTESLEIKDDHTFTQVFKLTESDYLYEGDGEWELIRDKASGCVYLYMHQMRFYYQVFEIAENGNVWNDSPEFYWDSCEEQPIEMVDKTILFVAFHPDSSNGVVLWHMTSQKDGMNMVFKKIAP